MGASQLPAGASSVQSGIYDTGWFHPFAGGEIAKVGTWISPLDTTHIFSFSLYNSSSNLNDQIDVGRYSLAPGTWTFQMITSLNVDRGIATVQLDDGAGVFTTVGTIDGYAASTLDAYRAITGITIASFVPGRILRLLIGSKNASSSDYYFLVNAVRFLRTGA